MSPTFDVALSTITGEEQVKKRLCCRMFFVIKGIDQTKIQSSVEKHGGLEV